MRRPPEETARREELSWIGRTRLGRLLLGDPGDVRALEARDLELVLRRLPRAVAAAEGSSAVGGSAGDFAHVHQLLAGVGDADDDHALVQERVVKGGDRGL